MRVSSTAAIVATFAMFPAAVLAEEPRRQLSHGVSVVFPDGWRVASPAEADRSKASAEPADPEAASRIQRGRTPETLILLGKHPPEHVGLNPSIHIYRQALPPEAQGWTAQQLIRAVLPLLQRAYHNVRLEADVADVTVGGHSAARAAMTYEIHGKSGRVIAARAETIVLLTGDAFLVIGMSSPSAGADDARAEFQRFVEQLRIVKPAA